jgi:hypothetical protein
MYPKFYSSGLWGKYNRALAKEKFIRVFVPSWLAI